MIRIGNFNTLEIMRSAPVGIYLEDKEGTEILLPNNEVPSNIKKGDSLRVFCYLDSEERPVATLKEPLIQRGGFAFLEVGDVSSVGAFMDWGLPKQLMVPFREQKTPFEVGQKKVVHCLMDDVTGRLYATHKVEKYLKPAFEECKPNERVEILPFKITDLGVNVIVNQEYSGLIFKNQLQRNLAIGITDFGYVKSIREDGKLDITLTPQGKDHLDYAENIIAQALEKAGGRIGLHDKSSPEEIKARLGLSKKAFKKGVGILYKKRLILLTPDGIMKIDKT